MKHATGAEEDSKMDQPDSWRTLLGNRINRDFTERQRLAAALGINPATLTRWANGTTNPRLPNLRQLLLALPDSESSLYRELIAQEFPEFAEPLTEPDADAGKVSAETITIPVEFYERVISTYAMTPTQRRFWAISTLVLQQMLAKLDPNLVGMSITIARCMPPERIRTERAQSARTHRPGNTTLAGYSRATGNVPGN